MDRRVLLITLASWMLAAPVALYAQSAQASDAAAAKSSAATSVVNLNTATAAQLESLPGIGAKTAERIIEYRQKNGNFKKVEELMNVKGIGEKSFLKLKNRLTVGATKD
jgi:competence protein ComEA